jgi:UDP-2,4-diacetamido-2,4,6-trideoxy-beta-L-altropyranose hydrolase
MWGFWTLCRNDNLIGTGHIKRCLTLAKHILAKHEKVSFIINKNEYAIELLKQNHIPYYIDDNVSNIPDNFFKYLFLDVYDGFDDDKLAKEKLRLSKISIGISDYFKFFDLKCDISIFTNGAITQGNFSFDNCIIGAQYLIAESDFYNFKRPYKGHIKNILITFGGYDPFNVTQIVLNSILYSSQRFEKLKFNILLGPMYLFEIELIESLQKSNLQFEIYKNVKNIISLYKENDFVITAGGNTFYEISIMGIPSLVISQNARQHNALLSIQSSLRMKYIGFYKDLLTESIGNEFDFQINNPKGLSDNSKSCLDFFNYDGKDLIYKKIKKYEKQADKR